MTAFTPPRGWHGWPFTVKAAFLCSTGRARDYGHACSLLAKRKKPRVLTAAPEVPDEVAQKRWDLRD